VAVLTALYDACVLYPAPVRDLLLNLAEAGLVRARWTDEIHDEWIRSVLEQRPDLSRARLERTQAKMNEAIWDSLITGFEDPIPSLELPDPNDRHVLAAAIRGQASVIVTFNLRDFPADILAGYGIEAQHPDDFIAQLLDRAPGDVCAAVKRQRESLRHPPKTVEELLTTLESLALVQAVTRLREFAELL